MAAPSVSVLDGLHDGRVATAPLDGLPPRSQACLPRRPERSFGQLHDDVFRVVARSPVLFVVLPLLVWLPVDLLFNRVAQLAATKGLPAENALLVHLPAVANLIVGTWVAGTQLYAMKELSEGRVPTAREAIRQGLRLWGSMFAVRFAVAARATLAALALIIPAFYFLVRYAFVEETMVFEGLSSRQALMRCGRYVKDREWQVGWYLAAYVLLYLPFALAVAVVVPADAGILHRAVSTIPFNIILSLLGILSCLIYIDRRTQVETEGWQASPEMAADPPLPAGARPVRLRTSIALVAALSVGTLVAGFAFTILLVHFEKEAGMEALKDRHYSAAVKKLSRAASWDPNDAALQHNLGVAYLNSGDSETAIVHLRQAITEEPSNALFHANQALALTRLRRREAARAELAVARSLGADPVMLIGIEGLLTSEPVPDSAGNR